MRAMLLLIGCLTFFVGACASKVVPVTPPPLPHKEWLTGKWKNTSVAHFLTGYEFDKEGVVKVTFRGMKEAISGRYSWSSERTIDLDFPKTADVEKAYEEAAKAYKQDVNDRLKKKEIDGRAGPSLLRMASQKMPEKETFTVGLVDPKYLVLSRTSGAADYFEKQD